MTHHTRIFWGAAALMLAVFVTVATAQDTGDGEPIAPAVTNTPAAPPTEPPPTTLPAEPTLIPSATATVTATPIQTTAPVLAATNTPLPPGFTPSPTAEPVPRGVVAFNSVFIREQPAPDAVAVASAFRDDQFEVVGRNADGTWFEVRRPLRENNIGWISVDVLDYDLRPEDLPLTDATTRVTGPVPINPGAPLAVFVVEGVALRDLPNRQQGTRLLNVPPNVTLPVTARYGDGAWLQVNYLGTEGWIIGFVARERDGLLDLPEIVGIVPGDTAPSVSVRVVPPELQLERLEEIRAFTNARLSVANDLEGFWFAVQRGDVLPCNPPASVDAYRYSGEDVRVLPEIDRYAPRLNEGVGFLNESIAVLARCGVIDPFDVNAARNRAVNARIILANTLVQLDNLEEIIR